MLYWRYHNTRDVQLKFILTFRISTLIIIIQLNANNEIKYNKLEPSTLEQKKICSYDTSLSWGISAVPTNLKQIAEHSWKSSQTSATYNKICAA